MHVTRRDNRAQRGKGDTMAKAEIQVLSGPKGTVARTMAGMDDVYYAEGMSAKLVADPEYLPDMEDGPDARWFCFEEPWVNCCMILSKDCGFTATQILEAREQTLREEAEINAIQAAEMRAETFAAEAVMGMAPGTTEGWYDEPPMGDDLDDVMEDDFDDEPPSGYIDSRGVEY
jgi:hypothetical protein